MKLPVPGKEKRTIEYFARARILDAAAVAACNEVTRLATQICHTPIGVICLDRGMRQWLPSLIGLPSKSIPQVLEFCNAVDAETGAGRLEELLLVPDTLADERLAKLALVKKDPKIRFYVGVSLIDRAGLKIGKLCVMATVPQKLHEEQLDSLRSLGRLCIERLEHILPLPGIAGEFTQSATPTVAPPEVVELLHLHHKSSERLKSEYANENSTVGQNSQLERKRDRDIREMRPSPLGTLGTDEEWKTLMSHIPGAIYRCSDRLSRGIWFFISEGISQIVGYPASSLVYNSYSVGESSEPSRTYASLIHPEDRLRVDRSIEQAITNREPFCIDYRLIHADSSLRWVCERGQGIFGKDSQLLYIDGIILENPTGSTSADSLPHPYEEDTLLTHPSSIEVDQRSTDAFFKLDRQWRFTDINSRAQEMLSRNRQELIGKNIWEQMPELINSNLAEDYRRAMCEQGTVKLEAFYPPRKIWLEMQAQSGPEGLSVYLQDVTLEKNSEKKFQECDRLSAFSAEMGSVFAQGGALPKFLQGCMDALVQHLDMGSACLWILNSSNNRLELQASAGKPLNPEIFPAQVPVGSSAIGTIAENRQLCSGWLSPRSDRLEELFTNSCFLNANFVAQPLIVDERLVGVMLLIARHTLTDAVHSVLGWITNGIAIAVDRAWAREALLSRREGLLFRLASQIRNSLDLDTILETAVHEIRSLLQIDRCHFLWYLPQSVQPSLTVTHESRDSQLPSLLCEYPPQHSRPLANKIRNLECLRIDDISSAVDLDESTHAVITDMGITSQLLLPLETRSGQLGAVVCSHCSGPRPWIDSEVELLQGVVDQLALAIDQAELYAQTHAAALAAQTQAGQLSVALQNLKHTQAQLIQTEKMSSLGQMVAGIAHEINNPVNFITGNLVHANNYTQDLLHLIEVYQKHYPDADPEVEEVAEEIDLDFLSEDLPKILASMQMGADRIRQIVLSLRNFSRLDEAEMKPVDIHEGIDNTLLILHNRWKPKGKDKGIEIIKEYAQLPRVECYAGQLNQVFMNILANAMDALENQPEPHIITISTQMVGKDARGNPNQVVIRIRDNGPGMTEDVRKRLFDPFFTTKPVGKGTGLGLSISYKIVVEKHGGILRCESKPGQGSEFCIQIPIKQSGVASRCA